MKKTIKWFLAIAMLLSSILTLHAQSMYGDQVKADVKVKYVHSLDEALAKAKKEDKLIFFNCFADWAIPCHAMNQAVFSDQAFGDFLNENFVNLILDLSIRENMAVKDKYKVRFFAHYLILDKEGNVVHRISGGSPLPDFKDKVVRSMNPKTSLSGLEKEFEKGNRSVAFLSNYYNVVSDAGYTEVAEEVRDLYVSKVSKKEMTKSENWKMFASMVEDIESEWFAYFKKNKRDFIKNNGEKKVKEYAALQYMRAVMPFISSTVGYSQDNMDAIMKGAKEFGLDPTNDFFVYYNLAYKRNRSSLSDYVAYLEPHISKIHPTFATGVDLSLKNIMNVSPAEQIIITDYLSRRMVGMSGSSLQQYQTAVKEIKRENGIIFEQGEFEAALKKAKAENKLIFLDAYTTWCGPCKVMAQQVFTQDAIGEYFNKTFINFKMDMESGEGPKWAKEFKISAYPTFLLINGDGELIHKVVGAHRANDFVNLINKGLTPETAYANLKKEYEKGNRDPKFIRNYLEGMGATGDIRDTDTFLEKYFSTLSGAQKDPAYTWPLVERFSANIDNKYWNAIMSDKAAIQKLVRDSTFMAKVESVYGPILYNAIGKNEKEASYVKAKQDLANFKLPENTILSNLLAVEELKDQSKYADIIDFYQDSVVVMADSKGRTNMDLLWKYMITSLNNDQKKVVLAYLQKQHAAAGPRAVNSYKTLLDAVM